jgi:hypothetical protein
LRQNGQAAPDLLVVEIFLEESAEEGAAACCSPSSGRQIARRTTRGPLHNLSTSELDESKKACHEMKIAIVVEQRRAVFDAPRPEEIDCLADCDPAPAQKTKIASARDGKRVSSHRYDFVAAK